MTSASIQNFKAGGLLVLMLSASASSMAASHCVATEQSLWSCTAKGKLYELCASPELAKGGNMRYVAGRVGAPELVYPAHPGQGKQYFKYESFARAGGISFQIGDYEYLLVDPLIGESQISVSRVRGQKSATITCDVQSESLTLTKTMDLFKAAGVYDAEH